MYNYAFQYADIKQLIVGEEDDANVYQFGQYAFYSSNIDYIKINKNYVFSYTNPIVNTNIKKGVIYINLSNPYKNISGISPDINYKESELDIIYEKEISGGIRGLCGFGKSNLRSIIVKNITSATTSESGEGNALNAFTGNYQKLDFGDLKYFAGYTYTRAGSIEGTADRVYFPSLERISDTLFSASAVIGKVFFGYSNCTLGSLNANILTKPCYFKPEYIDNYSKGTNWTSFFVNDGNEEPQMRVYREYASGDALPTQIGTTQVYNVTWYEDDDFTTPAGSTATANKEYYGKISAVV